MALYTIICKHYNNGIFYFICRSETMKDEDGVFVRTTSYEYCTKKEGDIIVLKNTDEIYGESFVEMLTRITNEGIFSQDAYNILTNNDELIQWKKDKSKMGQDHA